MTKININYQLVLWRSQHSIVSSRCIVRSSGWPGLRLSSMPKCLIIMHIFLFTNQLAHPAAAAAAAAPYQQQQQRLH